MSNHDHDFTPFLFASDSRAEDPSSAEFHCQAAERSDVLLLFYAASLVPTVSFESHASTIIPASTKSNDPPYPLQILVLRMLTSMSQGDEPVDNLLSIVVFL